MEPTQIILIEDNPADVYLFKFALKSSGIDCVIKEFTAGVDAVRELCTDNNNGQLVPDVIVMDLNTPRTDGFRLLADLRETPRFSQTPIAVLTSSRSSTDRERVTSCGARFIEKRSDLRIYCRMVVETLSEMLSNRIDS